MELNPTIPERTTEELLEIIEAPEQWRPDVVALAQKELRQRGMSIKRQDLRRKSYSKFHKKIKEIKARASYTQIEKLLIVLFGPPLFVICLFLFKSFLFYPVEGYKKKNRQGLLFLLLGIVLWVIVFAQFIN